MRVLIRICTVYHNCLCFNSTQVPVTQLDRVSDYGSESWKFNSFRAQTKGILIFIEDESASLTYLGIVNHCYCWPVLITVHLRSTPDKQCLEACNLYLSPLIADLIPPPLVINAFLMMLIEDLHDLRSRVKIGYG